MRNWPVERFIFSLIVGSGLRLTTTGILAGLIAALALTRLMTSMLVNIEPSDAETFVSRAVLLSESHSWLLGCPCVRVWRCEADRRISLD